MTDKELEIKATEYAEEQEKYCVLGVYDDDADLEYDKGYNIGYVNGLEEGYIAGAKTMQEENEQLRQQIEKIKICASCPNWIMNPSIKYCDICKNKEVLSIMNGS